MNYNLETNNTFRLGSIQNGATNVFYAKLTADFHSSNNPKLQATALVYKEALLSGAGTLTREEFLDAVRSIGASLNIEVAQNSITFILRARAEQAQKLLALFSLIITAPTFTAKEIKRIRNKIHNELSELKEEAKYLAHVHLMRELFDQKDRRHYAAPATLQTHVAQVTKKDLTDLHQVVRGVHWQATVGTDTKAVTLFSQTLQQLKNTAKAITPIPAHAPNPKPKPTVQENIPSKQNLEYSIGAALPLTIHHPDYIPFVFGLAVLGKWGGFTGRLMSTVREKEGLTYGIYARTESMTGTETGYWRIMTFFNPKDAARGLASTFREIKKIAKSGITTDEYRRFKTILGTQQKMLTDSYVRSLDDLHAYVVLGLTLEEMETIKAKLFVVTEAEVNQALKKYLKPEQVVISSAGPVEKLVHSR